jgi:MtN3 and saliva related transmembrane protein
MIFNALQLIGGAILALGQVPQIIQILKTKSVKDLNMKTYIMMVTGISMMEVYAVNLVLHGSGGAFLITNTLSLVSASVMVVLILKYRKREEVC